MMHSFWALLLVVSCKALPMNEEWDAWKIMYGKTYESSTEDNNRMKTFYRNKQIIEEHNKKYHSGLVSFFLKMNRFADLTVSEYREMFLGIPLNYSETLPEKKLSISKIDIDIYENLFQQTTFKGDLTDAVDWRDKGAVTGIKDQGKCGACWAFSTTGALEGQLFITKGQLISLSEQQLLDCSSSYGNKGCNGGLMSQAFIYISANSGIDTEDSYPYEGAVGSCRFKSSDVAATVSKVFFIEPNNEGDLQEAVATVGPVSVSIDSSLQSFQLYGGGIYYDSGCNATNLNHAALAIGYGTEGGQEYWLVKNSWGTNWGEQGYIRMSRNKNNNCGIATAAEYPRI